MPADATTLTIEQLGRSYRNGELRPAEVTRQFLDRIEVGPVYREVLTDRALDQAERAQRQFESGVDVGPLQGIPLAIKDLLDVEGAVTAAGSKVLAKRPPATSDAPAVARLDAAGAVFLGKTNMTELAFSGLGLNPHYGTPGNALDEACIPGGSSSGSAIAVAKGLACAAVGSDTGGSVRIPAAFNRLVGLKTSDGAVPSDGCAALSFTLDTIGPITRTPTDAWILYRAMAALPPAPLPKVPGRLRLLSPTNVVRDELSPGVAQRFEAAIGRLREQGHEVEERELPLLNEVGEAMARFGSIAAHEALALYGELLEHDESEMDPRVASRIAAVRERPSSDYIRHMLQRRRWQQEFWSELTDVDALVAPTVAIEPPRIDDLSEDDAYFEANRLCLRNTTLFNVMGGASISVPLADGPVGVMISAGPGSEGLVTAVAENCFWSVPEQR